MKWQENIIITNPEKDGAVVIQDVKQYIKEAERQLNNTKNCRPLPNDPTKKNHNTVKKTI